MLVNVVFSYNRAMQLDCFLESYLKHNKCPGNKVAVVFHTSGDHKLGYEKLIEKYENHAHVIFYEREKLKYYFLKIIPLFLYPRNLYRFLKYKFLRRKVDNFKFLVEDIIRSSGCEFTMFSTDDTFYDGDFNMTQEVVDKIRANPYQYSYRLGLGLNIDNLDHVDIKSEGDLISWNYYEKLGVKYWGYPFIVDGTIYDSMVLLEIISKLLYHMPGTLESFGNTYVSGKGYFGKGLAPQLSCLSNIWLNRVQHLGDHASMNINVEMLNRKFLQGYNIKYVYRQPVHDWGTIPDKVFLKKDSEEIQL